MAPVSKYSMNDKVKEHILGEQILIYHRFYKPCAQAPGQTSSYTKNVFIKNMRQNHSHTVGDTTINCVISEN